ncbi:MAG TPA: beta-propeller fold lactonase family protein [Candidatus Saccharimonadales bacterium]|nr:beta-propeller fold lactonase family protein [Candidatus Saccharimonadales bacterium]
MYIETNGNPDNQIIAFYRHGDGTLTEAGRFSSGGSGTGLALPDFSTGGITLSTIGNRQFVLVTNAGSNDVSVLSVQAHGLTIVSKAPSGGVLPVSLTQHGKFVYVVNEATGNINGYTIAADGQLTEIHGSSRGLSGGANSSAIQVLFNNGGTTLAVTEQNPDAIDIFEVDPETGLAAGPRRNASVGVEPFGMIFDQFDDLLVTEGTQGGPIASMSSYDVKNSGELRTISGAVQTPHPFTCWIALTNANAFEGGQFGFTANFGDSTISSYFVRPNGSLVLKQAVAATTRSTPNAGAIDESVSSDGAFLYVTDLGFTSDGTNHFIPLPGSVNVYAISADGALIPIQQVSGLPHNVMGSAAR